MPEPWDRLQADLDGRYRIERIAGRGGMATVYRAHDLRHDRPVALKVLDPELAASLGTERFLREIGITARLHHPHILPLFDSGEAGGRLYYVMPFVVGESLRERLDRERQLPLDDTLAIAREVAAALAHAHAHGIVHRDVKPANVLLSGGHALVTDFGIARPASPSAGLTSTGFSVGTPAYMSPEQAAGGTVDERSDVYALACVVYEMLAGQPPFTGATPESVAYQHLAVDPPPVTNLRPGLPAAVADVLRHGLAKAPADRPRSITDFAAALARAAAAGGAGEGATDGAETVAIAPARGPVPARRGRSRAPVIAAVVLLAGVGAVAMLVARPRGRGADAIRSIAVLPLENLSGDPEQEYLAQGMTDELTSALSGISALHVVSRMSSAALGHARLTAPEIARRLGVEGLVEGTIQRAGDRVRITARLVHGPKDREVWTRSLERSMGDVLSLRSDVAREIAAEIGVVITEGERLRLEAGPALDPASQESYLRGRFAAMRWNAEGMREAIPDFERAVQLEPRHARAWAALGHATAMLSNFRGLSAGDAFPRARLAAERALALDSTLAEAHTALALVAMNYDRDWDRAGRAFRRARALDPSYAEAARLHALFLGAMGRADEALAEMEAARRADPLSTTIAVHRGWLLIMLGRENEAIEWLGRVEPLRGQTRRWLAAALAQAGRDDEALAQLEAVQAEGETGSSLLGALASAYARAGRRRDAERMLAALEALPPSQRSPLDLARARLAVGDRERAMDLLEQAWRERSGPMVFLGAGENFDELRGVPRFDSLLARLNFPEEAVALVAARLGASSARPR